MLSQVFVRPGGSLCPRDLGPGEGVSAQGVSVQWSLSRGSLSKGGSLSAGALCQGDPPVRYGVGGTWNAFLFNLSVDAKVDQIKSVNMST